MKVRFWGVRGSFATPGPEFLHYGGNTTAIAVTADSGHQVLVDLGTGATEFAKDLMTGAFGEGYGRLPVLLTHTHIDHIQGLPFFTPFFIRGNSIQIMGAEHNSMSLKGVLQGQLNGHYSPLYGLENLAAGVEITGLAPGSSWPVEGFDVQAACLPHGGTQVMAYRICADEKSVVIMTDVEHPSSGADDTALQLAQGCDLLVHDAMFTDAEYAARVGWGHSSVSSAVATAQAADAKRLALFHHSPDARDEQITAVVQAVSAVSEVPVFAAREGVELVL